MEPESLFKVIEVDGVKFPVWAESAETTPLVPLIAVGRIADNGVMPGESFGLPPAKALHMLKIKGAVIDPRCAALVADPLAKPDPADAPHGEPMREVDEDPAVLAAAALAGSPVKRGRSQGRNQG